MGTEFLLLIYIFVLQIKKALQLDCFASSSEVCLDCAFDSYKPKVGLDGPISLDSCKKKDSGPDSTEVYISNLKCAQDSPCNGSAKYPYDNLINAFVKEGSAANSKIYSELQFKLLGSPHFIIRKHLLNGREQLFRRLNSSIIIKPHYCSELVIVGCFKLEAKPTIVIKTDLFYFYVSFSFKIFNITFNGADFHLHTAADLNSPSGNYNIESIICNYSLINTSYISITKTPCALVSRTLRLGEVKDFTRFLGLFTIEGILDNPSMKTPELVIENCEFYLFYAAKLLDGWLAFLVINDNYPVNLIILNCVFSSFKFAMGFIYVHIRESFSSNYSNYFEGSKRKIEFTLLRLEAYNDFNVLGSTFTYENKREFDVYGIFNIQQFKGEIYIFRSIIQNIIHRVRRHSLFILKSVSFMKIHETAIKNTALLSNLFLSENVNITLDKVVIEQIILYLGFIDTRSFSNFEIANTVIRDLKMTGQTYSVIKSIYQNLGSLFISNSSFVNTSSLSLYLFQISLTVFEANFENFDTALDPLFSIIDSFSISSYIRLKNLKVTSPSIFFLKNYLNKNVLSFKFFGLFASNISKSVQIYLINQTQVVDSILVNKTIKTIYPLGALITGTEVGLNDNIEVELMQINNFEIDKLFLFASLGKVLISNIAIENSVGRNFKLVDCLSHQSIQVFQVNISHVGIATALIELICANCMSEIRDFQMQNIVTDGAMFVVFSKGSKINITNFIVKNMNFVQPASLKPGCILYLKEGSQLDIANLTVTFIGNEVLMAVILIDSSQAVSMKYIAVGSEFGNYPNFARSAVAILLYVKTAKIEEIVSKNLRHFTNASITTQYGFLNFLGLDSTWVLHQENDFSISISKILLLNCSKYNYGVLGLVNYKNIELTFCYISNSYSEVGGAIHINFITSALLSNFYLSETYALKAGGLFLTNIVKLTIQKLKILGSQSRTSGGVAVVTNVEDFELLGAFLLSASCLENGGAFYFENSLVKLNDISAYSVYAPADGGLIYFVKGNLIVVSYLSAYNLSASNGGLIYSTESGKLKVENIYLEGSIIEGKGGSIFISRVIASELLNIKIFNTSGDFGIGNIYVDNLELAQFMIENITIEYCSLREGNFLYYHSNSAIRIKNLRIRFCEGGLIFINGVVESTVILLEFIFLANNVGGTISDFLIVSRSAQFFVKGESNSFINNTAKKGIFSLLQNSNFLLQNSTVGFEGYTDIYSLPSVLISIKNSSASYINVSIYHFYFQFITHEDGRAYFLNLRSSGCGVRKDGSGCFNFKNLDLLSVQNSDFISSADLTDLLGREFSIVDSNIIISNSFFMRTPKGLQSSVDGFDEDLVVTGSEAFVVISNCYFKNKGISQSVAITNARNITLNSAVFECEGVLLGVLESKKALVIKTSSAIITNGSFKNFFGQSGPSLSFISIDQTFKYYLYVNYSLFENSKAEYGGAIFIQGYIWSHFFENSFSNNLAFNSSSSRSGIAGVIYFVCKTNDSEKMSSLILQKNKFIKNRAEKFAAVVWSFARILVDSTLDNYFENNLDDMNFSSGLAGYPLTLHRTEFKLNTDSIIFYNESGGNHTPFIISGISFEFNITIKDNFSQILNFDSHSYLRMHGKGVKIQAGLTYSKEGILKFLDTVMFYFPGQIFNLNFSFKFAKNQNFPETNLYSSEDEIIQEVAILSRPCLQGEILNRDEPSCHICPAGKYSLQDPMLANSTSYSKCQECPKNAYCYSGSFITPVAGYWRAVNSTLILECLTWEACKGMDEELSLTERIHGRCAFPYSGPLCYSCENGYARFSSRGVCDSCNKAVYPYVRLVFGIIGLFIYTGLQVHDAFHLKITSYLGILIKLLLNHFQQLSLISLLELGWSSNINYFFSFQDHISFLMDDIISIDCLLQKLNYNKLILIKVVISNMAPLILGLLATTAWIGIFLIKSKKEHQYDRVYLITRIITSLIIVSYVLYPEILRRNFSLFNCMRIDNLGIIRVLKQSPDLECWNDDHISYIIKSSLPGMLIWGLFIPLVISMVFKFNSNLVIRQVKSEKKKSNSKEGFTEKLDIMNQRLKLAFINPETSEIDGKPVEIGEAVGISSEQQIPMTSQKELFDNKRRGNLIEVERDKTKSIQFKKAEPNKTPRGKHNDKKEAKITSFPPAFSHQREQYILTLKIFYKGYSSKYYWWESVLYLRRLSLAVIGSLTEIFPGTTKPTVVLIILSIYIYLQMEYQPFEKKFLNSLELVSLLVTFFTANMGLLLLTDVARDYGSLLLAFIILFNAIFLVAWVWCLYKEVIRKAILKRRNKKPKFKASSQSLKYKER